jgi:nitrate reductase beta subunit
MKVRAQIAMVLNLDKCIGCHTCSITCKNVWTSREGVEYAWFNNVETKPGVGYPKEWENQEKWNGGWVRSKSGKLLPKAGGRWRMLAKIFANPDLPQIDDYYEPFDFDYQHLHEAPDGKHQPTARPRSLISGERMQKIHWGPNWEEILGTEFAKRSKDKNFDGVQKEIYGAFEKTFMMYLPRLCEHCLNPACVSACPSGAIYKREEDGIVLIDQDKCRGWRMCVSACPYKKIYYNWKSGKSEKCIFCYPRIEMRRADGVLGNLRRPHPLPRRHALRRRPHPGSGSTPSEKDLYRRSWTSSSIRSTRKSSKQARKEGIPDNWLDAARPRRSTRWRSTGSSPCPLHPEYRTLPMVWYVPPLSPIQSAAERGHVGKNGELPDVGSLRIPVRYLANLLTAGDERPVVRALERLLAMRAWRRAMNVDGVEDLGVLQQAGLTVAQAQDMYRYLAIANYEDRFVIPTAHREYANDAFGERGGCGFSWGNGCSGDTPADLFTQRKTTRYSVHPNRQEKAEVVE